MYRLDGRQTPKGVNARASKRGWDQRRRLPLNVGSISRGPCVGGANVSAPSSQTWVGPGKVSAPKHKWGQRQSATYVCAANVEGTQRATFWVKNKAFDKRLTQFEVVWFFHRTIRL